MLSASCHPTNHPPVDAVEWKVSAGERRTVAGNLYVGEVCESHVMVICRGCPQQWLCARYAVETDVRTGTWGVPYKQIDWLKRRPDALSIIDHARVQGITVERAVGLVKGLAV